VTVLIDADGICIVKSYGKQKLSQNGYVYVKNKTSANGEVFWNCEKCTSDKCKATVHTKTGDATVIRRINENNQLKQSRLSGRPGSQH